MEGIILFILALLPVAVLGYYTYSQDDEKEPKKLLTKLFLGGLLSAILTVLISFLIRMFFPWFDGEVAYYSPIKLLIYTFIVVALVEEVSKFIILYYFSYNSKEYDQLYDMIVYSVFVSLGFAWIENLLYVYDGGISIALTRLVFAVPTHASVAVFMGYYLSLSKLSEINNKERYRVKYLIYSILFPTILHGVYDFIAYSSNLLIVYSLFLFTCYLYSKAHRRLKQMAKVNMDLLVPRYCPKCGMPTQKSEICPNCGNKII